MESGDKSETQFFNDLQKKGICVISANYRMYPTAVYPQFIEDAAEVVSWSLKNTEKYGKVTDVFIGGSSAGGYITQMLCFEKKYLMKYNINPDDLSGYIMDAGQPTVHFNVLRERNIDSRRVIIDEAAPIYHICGERNYPPIKIIVSDHDMQNRYEQNCLLVSTLKHFDSEAKVDFNIIENSEHCSYINKKNDEGKFVFADIISNFIYKNLKS